MTKRIRKAVFPVAGLGTRFLLATKSIPKEMLAIDDRPGLQHVVEGAQLAPSLHKPQFFLLHNADRTFGSNGLLARHLIY